MPRAPRPRKDPGDLPASPLLSGAGFVGFEGCLTDQQGKNQQGAVVGNQSPQPPNP